ncbi:hypothetical protein KA183_03780 [bacterium]|nr:hypothetical protein [bacterium]
MNKKFSSLIVLCICFMMLTASGCGFISQNSILENSGNFKSLEEPEKTLTDLTNANKVSESSMNFAQRGHILMTLGRLEEARNDLKKAVEIESKFPVPAGIYDYVCCLASLKQYKDVLECTVSESSNAPSINNYVTAKTLALANFDQNDKALQAAARATDQAYDPAPRLYYLQAQLLRKLGKEDEAKRILNIATLSYPETIVMKSGKRMSPLTTPLYADCVEQFLKLNNPNRALGTASLANVLGERSLRMTVLEAIARAKMDNPQNIPKAQKLIESEKQFWKTLKSSSL